MSSAEITTPDVSSPSVAAPSELRTVLRQNWWRLSLTYALFNIENVLRLAQPLLLGWAINGLLHSSWEGVIAFATGHMLHMLIRTWRQMFDTRTFTRIHAGRAGRLVVRQRGDGVDVSRVAARSMLTREFVEFFERHVPLLIRSVYSLVGALIMLAWYDVWLVLYCLVLIVPACALNFWYGKRTLDISRLLHDQMEREVEIVGRARQQEVRQHYRQMAGWRVRLSDCEAIAAGAMEIFVLGLMVAALLRYCGLPGAEAGDIFAVFRYVLLFVMGLDSLPQLVAQSARLKDIQGRTSCGRPKVEGRR